MPFSSMGVRAGVWRPLTAISVQTSSPVGSQGGDRIDTGQRLRLKHNNERKPSSVALGV